MSNPNIHLHVDLPLVVAGGGAGTLKGGRHLCVQPGRQRADDEPAGEHARQGGRDGGKLGDSTGRINLDTLSGILVGYREAWRREPCSWREPVDPRWRSGLATRASACGAGADPPLVVDAVKAGKIDAVRALIAKGVDPNADRNGRHDGPPLGRASRQRRGGRSADQGGRGRRPPTATA